MSKPNPLFHLGSVVRISPLVAEPNQPYIGIVVYREFGWKQRDDTVYPCWWYRLDLGDFVPGCPMIEFPEMYLTRYLWRKIE